MSKRGDRKRLMRRLKTTAKRIPLGAEKLPKWLKSHFPTIYAQHVAYRMIEGKGIVTDWTQENKYPGNPRRKVLRAKLT